MFVTMVIYDGVPCEFIHMGPDRKTEESYFLQACRESSQIGSCLFDAEVALDHGYVECSNGKTVAFVDLSNTPGYDTATRCIVEVSGGCVTQVMGDDSLSVNVVDWDNISAGDPLTLNGCPPDGSFDEFDRCGK